MILLSGILLVLTLIVSIPIATFSLQCFLSLLPRSKSKPDSSGLPRLAVLIPAHNEEDMISGILQDVSAQAKDGDRIIVIADNCTDSTADVARQHGAEAFERSDTTNRGKSHALRFALERLESDPPEVVIIVDADCRISSDALALLSGKAAKLNRPIQGSYIFGDQDNIAISNLASTFTLWFKNHIRPLGSLVAGMPCQLTGSGMAFPWKVIRSVNVANASLAEDTTLGLDLAYLGHAPLFCPEARIDGQVPKAWDTLVQQRRRWEQGYLESIFTNAPRMVMRAITRFQPGLLWATFDLCIPPLTLLGFLWGIVTLMAALFAAMSGNYFTLMVLCVGAILTGLSLVSGWWFHCRKQVPITAILAMPWFLIRKIRIYVSLLLKRQKVWLRTERD